MRKIGIEQTNRTILFDAINPEKYNLFQLMTDVSDDSSSLTDEKVEEISEHLLVRSFDEFLDKFKPTIYYYFGYKEDEYGKADGRMIYSLEYPTDVPKELVNTMVIDKSNDFLKMFINLIDSKRDAGKTNVSFDYQKIIKQLSPEKNSGRLKI